MAALKEVSGRIMDDVRHGRQREAFALFLVGVALVILGLAGVASDTVLRSAILLALSFLVLDTASAASGDRPALDEVLRVRENFGAFSKLLPGVRDLRIYGPTAVNVLVHSADIRRFVLSAGGTVRVIVQDEDPSPLAHAANHLDDILDLARRLHSSFGIMDRLAAEPGFSYRKLGVNPGFSLLIVNPGDANGYVIVESHGFKDENIADRMHIEIRRKESRRWFSYWVARFDAMWESAKPPQ